MCIKVVIISGVPPSLRQWGSSLTSLNYIERAEYLVIEIGAVKIEVLQDRDQEVELSRLGHHGPSIKIPFALRCATQMSSS